MSDATVLPAGFEALAPHVERWALPDMRTRNDRRVDGSTLAELRAFYAAMAPLMEPLLDYFAARPAQQALTEPEQRLHRLGLSFMEVAMAVEYFGTVDVPDGFERARWQIVRG